jgi:hypothetical protein
MSLNRNKSDVLKGVQMMEKEEEKDEYKVSALLQHLRPKEENRGSWTCRKRTYGLSTSSMYERLHNSSTYLHLRKWTYMLLMPHAVLVCKE